MELVLLKGCFHQALGLGNTDLLYLKNNSNLKSAVISKYIFIKNLQFISEQFIDQQYEISVLSTLIHA